MLQPKMLASMLASLMLLRAEAGQEASSEAPATCPSLLQVRSAAGVTDPLVEVSHGSESPESKIEGLAEEVLASSTDSHLLDEARKVIAGSSSLAALAQDQTEVADILDAAEDILTPEAAARAGVEMTSSDLSKLAQQESGKGHFVDLEEAAGAFQGDMMPDNESQMQAFELSAKTGGGPSYGAGTPWAGGVVKYCFAPDIKAAAKKAVDAAVLQYKKAVPCLQWKDVGYASGEVCQESPAVYISSKTGGCYSYVGMLSRTSQALNLASPGCDSLGTAIHELGHAIGMTHEQSRPDRDDNVRIIWDNIKSGVENNFELESNSDASRPYDILSVMHYSKDAFGSGKQTIEIKPTAYARYTSDASKYSSYEIGDRIGLSQLDADQVADLYKSEVSTCKANTLSTATTCTDRKKNGAEWRDTYGQGCAVYKSMEASGDIDSCKPYVSGVYCCDCGGGFRLQTWTPSGGSGNVVPTTAAPTTAAPTTAAATTAAPTTAAPTTSAPACQDSAKYRDPKFGDGCPGWVGFSCSDWSFSAELKANCPQACKQPCATTTTTTTTTTTEKCEDSPTYTDPQWGDDCPGWVGFTCTGYSFSAELVAECPKACRACAGGR
jgi:hypothetical protein